LAKLNIRYLLEKRLADGSTAYYYNAPKRAVEAGILERCDLGTDKGIAAGKAEIYNAMYDEWRRGDPASPEFLPGTIGWLAEQFQESGWYTKLAPKTKKGYDADLKRIKEYKLKSGRKLGLYLAGAISPTIADAFYADLVPRGLRTANGVMVMAHRLWKYGKRYHGAVHGIDQNPFHQMGLQKTLDRSEMWTMGQVETFVAKADDMGAGSIGTAALICYMFNQRVTTAITAPWTAWNGEALQVRQSKRGRLVWVPALPELRDRLNGLKEVRADAVQIVIDERYGRPYDEYSFSHRAGIIREAAGIPNHLQVRDLRRTGITETRAAGGTDHELQATSGNNKESLQIYSVPSNAEATSAIRKRLRHRTKLKRKPG
jgi:hypothetical protein